LKRDRAPLIAELGIGMQPSWNRFVAGIHRSLPPPKRRTPACPSRRVLRGSHTDGSFEDKCCAGPVCPLDTGPLGPVVWCSGCAIVSLCMKGGRLGRF